MQEARIPIEAGIKGDQSIEGTTISRNKSPSRAVIPSLRVFLLSRLKQLDVADYKSNRKGYYRKGYSGWDFQPEAPQLRTLDKDIELLIKGYGFTTINHRDHAPS